MNMICTFALICTCVCLVTSQAPVSTRAPTTRGATGRLQPPVPTRPPKERMLSVAGVVAKALGKSGKIEIGRDNEPEKDMNGIVIEFDSVQELDTNGKKISGGKKKHSFPTFANQNFTFTNPENITYQNYSATAFNFTATLKDIDARVTVQLMIFREHANITNGDEDVFIEQGNVKFNIEIKDWPFCGQTETCQSKNGEWLEFVLTMKGNKPPKRDDNKRPMPGKGKGGKQQGGPQGGKPQQGGPGGKGGPKPPKPTGSVPHKPTGSVPPKPTGARLPKPTGAKLPKPTGAKLPKPTGMPNTTGGGPSRHSGGGMRKKGQFFDFGEDSGVTLSTKVVYDGIIDDMPTNYPKYERRGNKESFVFRFKRFNRTVFYDPTIAASPTYGSTSGASSLASHLVAFLVPALLLAWVRL